MHPTKHPRTSMINIQGPCPLDSPRSPPTIGPSPTQVSNPYTFRSLYNKSKPPIWSSFPDRYFSKSNNLCEKKLDGTDEDCLDDVPEKHSVDVGMLKHGLQLYSYIWKTFVEDVLFFLAECHKNKHLRIYGNNYSVTLRTWVKSNIPILI